eukprot:6099903-Lingulodinium_polyedra.AAC.1
MHAAVAAGRTGGRQQHAWDRAACRSARGTRARCARRHSCAEQEQAGVHGRSCEGQQRTTAR